LHLFLFLLGGNICPQSTVKYNTRMAGQEKAVENQCDLSYWHGSQASHTYALHVGENIKVDSLITKKLL
jgi:hypothetical protein